MGTLEYDQFDFLFSWEVRQERSDFVIEKGQIHSFI